MIDDVFERHVEGTDPFAIETLTRRIAARGYSARPDVSLVGVLSGIEMACWDIVGKAVGQPVPELLGGRVHDRLRAYTYLYPEPGDAADVYVDPDLAAERAAAYAAAGVHGARSSTRSARTRRSTRASRASTRSPGRRRTSSACARRSATGAICCMGTHGQLTPAGAIRLARRLERFDPLWFEEPVPPESPEQMATVARATSIPIATGERLTTKYEFARVLQTGAASILQPNLGRVGGLLEAKKIAGMAEAHYAQIAPHLYCGPVVGAANIQLATCSPNFLVLEGIQRWDGFHAEILRRPIQWEDGYVDPADGAGARRRARRGGRAAPPVRRATISTSCRAASPSGGDARRLRRRRPPRRATSRRACCARDSRSPSTTSTARLPQRLEAEWRALARLRRAMLARDADVVITCLPSPEAVAAVVDGRGRHPLDASPGRHVDRHEHERPAGAPAARTLAADRRHRHARGAR